MTTFDCVLGGQITQVSTMCKQVQSQDVIVNDGLPNEQFVFLPVKGLFQMLLNGKGMVALGTLLQLSHSTTHQSIQYWHNILSLKQKVCKRRLKNTESVTQVAVRL